MKDNFLQVAGEHARRYPIMEPQDFGKLAYQSEFGPEHLISDKQQAESFLLDEWKALPKGSSPQFPEPVSESLCCFPLSMCTSMDEIGLLVKLFIHTAEEHKGNVDGLEEKLEQLKYMDIPGGNMDLMRFLTEVLVPVKAGKQAIYRS